MKRVIVLFLVLLLMGCTQKVPHEERWGIYSFDLATEKTELIYSSSKEISGLSVFGDNFIFSQKTAIDNESEELFSVTMNGTVKQLTNNEFWDLYPIWSSDGSKIAFLTWRNNTLDIYVMNQDGSNIKELYASEFHDSDIHWSGNKIVFTRNSQIWMMDDDGTSAHSITYPPNAGEWGNANLPFGDYDPRLSPDGSKIVFERLVNDISPHGNYDIYIINSDGSGEKALTSTGYSQGLASWSHSGDKIVYLVAAIGTTGKYDLYMMNSDGTNNQDITPDYFPDSFLCHSPVFSEDDSKIYFVGEWWDD
ncbi:hypothetical protein KKB44_05920 [Candidatus Micrarchaeota archaeon]|nr:hypothetical protein [Candidatus Micrarchaeota archaeon]